jgi:phosphatidylethanolamine/phosphatidyl-N-methylethanolamine N-methyltransferase
VVGIVGGKVTMKQTLFFLRQWLSFPLTIGAVLPSTQRLGKCIVDCIPSDRDGYVIELGGGTGSLTRAILAGGVARDKLVVLEYNPHFVASLRQQFPGLLVLQADAAQLQTVLEQQQITDLRGIVSGLPLLSLPRKMRYDIIHQFLYYLKQAVPVIQFTYSYKPPIPKAVVECHALQERKTATVWLNIPPASVWQYTLKLSDQQ